MLTRVEEAIRTEEQRVIEDTLRLSPRPASIQGIEIEFGEDHSGYPAVWVWMIIPETQAIEGPEWDSVVGYCDQVGTILVQKRMTHWPYVSVRSQSRTAT